jgi:dipeptidyl-peptidase-4
MPLFRSASHWTLALCMASAMSALAQAPRPSDSSTTDAARAVTAADYARAQTFLPYATAPRVLHAIDNPTWLADDTLWYHTTTADGSEFVHIDSRKLDPRHTEAAVIESRTCAKSDERCPPLPKPNLEDSRSPDGLRVVFIRDFNLWARELASGRETQLTTDGVKDFGYATDNPGWEHTNRPIVSWSADSKKIATFQQDQRDVGDMYLVNTRLGHPELEAWKYAMAGDPHIATIQRVIIDLSTGSVVRLKIPPDPHRSSNCYDVQCGDGVFADVQWSPDGAHLAFVSTSRDHRHVQLRIADAASGTVREVLEETSATFYESDISSTWRGAVNWRYLPGTNEIIWLSERDNRAQLYLYDLRTGRLQHRITSGDWDVVELLRVDEKSRTLYVSGVGHEKDRDPYFVHLYEIGMDNGKTRLLTPENANHEITMSPSGCCFVDSYSTPAVPAIAVLRDRDGRQLRELERTDISALVDAGWRPPQPITVKARDGATDLYGLMFKPSHFDAAAKYPLVLWVYPGPQIGSVGSRSFAASRGDRQALAELGFIVVAIDGMGTPFRGKKFHDTYYDNMRDNTLPDQVAAVHQLAARFPWVDPERVGIYGHSGGGYAAANAMFTYPDVFKVGIAESGNHDPRAYTDDWGDKFTSSLEGQDNESLVAHLKGHLLLSHGTMDDNVPPYLTLLLVDSLIKANKDFDLVMLPNQHHPYLGDAGIYMTRRRWDYFVRYLRGVEPPHEFALRPSQDGASLED